MYCRVMGLNCVWHRKAGANKSQLVLVLVLLMHDWMEMKHSDVKPNAFQNSNENYSKGTKCTCSFQRIR